MFPISFKQQNFILKKPPTMEEECKDLPAFKTDNYILSCWSRSFFQRLKFLIFGKLWVWVYTPTSQPPIALTIERTPFK